jgi:ABC-type multidrug transport system ATPase subunit
MFDKVTLLYEGRQIYFGSVDFAVEYFTALGFVMPKGATTADFLTSLTSPSERVVRPGHEHVVPRLPEEFVIKWKHSKQAKAVREEIDSERTLYEGGQRLSISRGG